LDAPDTAAGGFLTTLQSAAGQHFKHFPTFNIPDLIQPFLSSTCSSSILLPDRHGRTVIDSHSVFDAAHLNWTAGGAEMLQSTRMATEKSTNIP